MNTAAPENPEAPKFSTAVVTAWHDMRDVLRVLFTPALIVFLILLALGILRVQIVPLTGLTAGQGLEKLLYDAVVAFLMTPYAIAVHRFIILGEQTMSYRITPAEPRFRRFFGWSLALSVLWDAPAALSVMLPALKDFLSVDPPFVLFVVLVGIVTVVAIRAIVLFPALAIDAPGANWRRAMADTRGHAWHIFFIIVGANLPLVIVAALPVLLRVNLGVTIGSDVYAAFGAILRLFIYTLAVVIASRLYQWIGIRVKERGSDS